MLKIKLLICIIIWAICGLVMSTIQKREGGWQVEWPDVLLNFIVGPIKLGCYLIANHNG